MSMATGRGGRPIVANIARLRALMERDGVDACVLRGGQNVTWLAGIPYHGTLARHLDLAASPRGVVAIWPREGDPALVVDATAAGASERTGWIERIEVYDGYQERLFGRVAKVLADMRLAQQRRRLALDRNFIGAGFWEELSGLLPGIDLIDGTALLDEARFIKTAAEVDMFRAGARLLDTVLAAAFPTIRAGEREREVHGRIIGGCLAQGAEFAHGIFNSHRNPVIYCGESAFVLERGDIIRTDYLAYLDCYPGHQSRNAVLGPPAPAQQRDYALYYDIYRRAAEQLRPGRTAGEIYDFVAAAFARIGWTYRAGLVGHSVGPWWHQQEPILCRGNRTPLEPGMVIALEPFVDHWHCQDLFLITEGEAELLSGDFDTSAMFVIA